jgi:hypothetical protein
MDKFVTSKPTIAEVEAVFNFIEYFDELHAEGELHLLDFGGPTEIAGRFEPIAHCWRRVLVAAAYPSPATIAQPDSPALVLGGHDRPL